MCVCDVCVDTYHEDLAYLTIHGHPADLRGQTKHAENSHVFTITMVTHGVAMVTNVAWLEMTCAFAPGLGSSNTREARVEIVSPDTS